MSVDGFSLLGSIPKRQITIVKENVRNYECLEATEPHPFPFFRVYTRDVLEAKPGLLQSRSREIYNIHALAISAFP